MRGQPRTTTVEELQGYNALDELGAHLDDLCARLEVPLTSRRPWLSAWVAAYPSFEPWVIVAWDGGTLVGACLLARRRLASGIEVVALGHGRNDRARFPTVDAEVAEALADRLVDELAELHEDWTLSVSQLRTSDPLALAIAARVPQAQIVPGGNVPAVQFGNDRRLDAHLSKNLRRQLQKCRNRIATDGVTAEIAFTRERDELVRLLDGVAEVHRSRDHEVGRVSDIDDPAGLRLWEGVILRHVERGEVEIATMRLDGTLAAYVVSFLDGPTYRVFDGRFLTEWERYSPGRLLETETLAHAMSTGFSCLDWMNSIAPEKLISANIAEATLNLVCASTAHATARVPVLV